MVKLVYILFSFVIPIVIGFLVPLTLLWLVESRTIMTLFNPNPVIFYIGFVPLIPGLILFVECIWLFNKIGKGTLAPLNKIETKHLVIEGPYKYVRNPMIIGVLLIVFAESLLFGSISILILDGIFLVVNMIYFPLSEEKGLEKRFGEEYLHYKKHVNAWIPKWHAYTKD